MNSIVLYNSDSDSDHAPLPVVKQYKLDAAPDALPQPPTTDLALVGPSSPTALFDKVPRSIGSGTVEVQAVDELMFHRQERQFRQTGPSRPKKKRKPKGDVSRVDGDHQYQGPWASYEEDTIGQISGPSAEQLAEYEKRLSDKDNTSRKMAKITRQMAYTEGTQERSTFHGTTEHDYQGRTYMSVPTELKQPPENLRCYAPKRMVKEWKQAHQGGTSAIRFIPDTGHLLLSSGMDGLVKVYDTHSSLKHLRTYIGHSKAVRDICFAPDGQSFLSSSYDSYTKLWDTETGQCKQKFSSGKKVMPYVAKFYPEDPNLFLVGRGDRKITQWDIRANETVQEYDQHMGAINSLTFIDSNRRFISTSDDKSLRVWEFGIPVVIKLVADPTMHSVPAVAGHPGGKWVVGQSMDNRLMVYNVGDKIRVNRRKQFRGHLTAGYACQPSFAPDGGLVASGDAEGGVWCWDWQTTKVMTKWKAHDKVTIGTEWHPRETSKLATCSWDGSIKYWD